MLREPVVRSASSRCAAQAIAARRLGLGKRLYCRVPYLGRDPRGARPSRLLHFVSQLCVALDFVLCVRRRTGSGRGSTVSKFGNKLRSDSGRCCRQETGWGVSRGPPQKTSTTACRTAWFTISIEPACTTAVVENESRVCRASKPASAATMEDTKRWCC